MFFTTNIYVESRMRAQKRENENLKKNNVLRLLEPIDYVMMRLY